MAPLVFLPRSAPAWIVAPDFMLWITAAHSTRTRCADRDTDRHSTPALRRGAPPGPVGAVRFARSGLGHRTNRGSLRRRRHRRDTKDDVHDRALDSFPKFVEHLEGFVLVLHQRVALAVGAEADALAELLHLREVLHPLPVDGLQHHAPLHRGHLLGAHLLDLPVIGLRRGRVEVLDKALRAVVHRFVGDLRARGDRQVRRQVLHQALEVPVLEVAALAVLVDALGDDVAHVAEDVLARVGAFQDLSPLLVHDLALLVHHVVVLDYMLAGVEVHALDLLLRARNRSGDPGMLDRLDLEAVHQAADAFRGRAEDLHQIVLERDEESARSRVPLPAGAAAELVVDAAALVPFGADDVQPTYAGDPRPEHDVAAAARHVGGDRDRAGLPGFGDDGRLPLVLLGVQHVVLEPAPLEHLGKPFGLLDRDSANKHRTTELVHFDDLVDH